jgi:hypothetical protein
MGNSCLGTCCWKVGNRVRSLRPLPVLIETANKASSLDEVDMALDELCIWVLQSESGCLGLPAGRST